MARWHWGRYVAAVHTTLILAFACVWFASSLRDQDQPVSQVASFFESLGVMLFVPVTLLHTGRMDSPEMPHKVLNYCRLALAASSGVLGTLIAACAYDLKQDRPALSRSLSITMLVIASLAVLSGTALFYGGWVSVHPRTPYKRVKSGLANASVVLVVFGSLLAIFATVWIGGVVSILVPTYMMLVVLAVTFEFVCLALGPSLLVALKWRSNSGFDRLDVVACVGSLGLVGLAEIMTFFNSVINTDWDARVTFTFPAALRIIAAVLLCVGVGLGIAAAVLAKRQQDRGYAIISVEDATYPPGEAGHDGGGRAVDSVTPPAYGSLPNTAPRLYQEPSVMVYDK